MELTKVDGALIDETLLESQTETRLLSSNLLGLIAKATLLESVDVHKLEALMRMQLELENREAERRFNQSMLAAQREIQPIVRDKKNTHTSSMYATLEAIDKGIREIYQRHGFALTFGFHDPTNEGKVKVSCDCIHDGGWTKHYQAEGDVDDSGLAGKKNKTNIQGVNATMTALKNSLTRAIFNVILTDKQDPDTDGNKPDPLITDEEYGRLIDLIHASNGSEVLFQQYTQKRFGIEKLRQLPQSKYFECVNALKARTEASSISMGAGKK